MASISGVAQAISWSIPWWEWAGKPLDSPLTISTDMHNAVMMLTPQERLSREIVNETVRIGRMPLRPVGSADQFGVPHAANT